jgi:myo-inositol-1(or 4)-monophosphatase
MKRTSLSKTANNRQKWEEYKMQGNAEDILEELVGAVEEAAAFATIMQDTGYGDAEGRKHGLNFATGADRAVETMLRASLSRIDEQAGFISEDDPRPSENGCNWIIDPIDGTGNFAAGMEYATAVAYADETGNVIAGAVCCPGISSTYCAAAESGAFIREIGSDKKEQLTFPEKRKEKGNLFFGMPRHPEKAARMMCAVGSAAPMFSDIKRMGPTSLDICKTASGTACCYLGIEPEIWDIAAASLIVEQAGGISISFGDMIVIGDPSVTPEVAVLLGVVDPRQED